MGLIKEPKDIDFYFENRDLTDEECRIISEYIKNQKLKRARIIRPLIKKKKKIEVL